MTRYRTIILNFLSLLESGSISVSYKLNVLMRNLLQPCRQVLNTPTINKNHNHKRNLPDHLAVTKHRVIFPRDRTPGHRYYFFILNFLIIRAAAAGLLSTDPKKSLKSSHVSQRVRHIYGGSADSSYLAVLIRSLLE